MFLQDLENRRLPLIIPEGVTPDTWKDYRSEVIKTFSDEVYGISPPAPEKVETDIISSQPREWAGKAEHREISIGFDTPGGRFSFPVHLVLPVSDKLLPLIIYISFTPYPVGEYGPIEEIIDNGYALAIIYYNDISLDKDDGFSSGLAAMYDRNGDDGRMWGKISMWAWASSRVMDYVQTMDNINKDRIYCMGHSRLGKTSLWCAAQDERFRGVASNNSGCSGVAVSRGKRGERISDIVKAFPYWFCKNYQKYADREHEMPFEQSQLVSMIAPRLLAVCNAEEDIWADPDSEFMSVYEAGRVYDFLGTSGLSAPPQYPKPGDDFPEGNIGYSLRSGTHFLSRHDWIFYLKFFDLHQ